MGVALTRDVWGAAPRVTALELGDASLCLDGGPWRPRKAEKYRSASGCSQLWEESKTG